MTLTLNRLFDTLCEGKITNKAMTEVFQDGSKCWLGILEGRGHSEDLGVDGNVSAMKLREIGGKVCR
jgi:hypothetical protein